MAHTKRLLLETIYVGSIAGTYTSSEFNLDDAQGFAIVASATADSLANKTFSSGDVSLSVITIASHGYKLGLKIRFTTTGVLPAGLSLATDYYLTDLTNNTLLVSTSYANALAGSYVTLTDGGSGTHTIAVQAASPVNLMLEGTIDGETWVFVNNSTKELSTEPYMLEHETAFYHKLRVLLIVASGQYNVNAKIMIKGGPF
jgi:hypothetical protein